METLNPKIIFTFSGCRHNVYHGGLGQGLPKHEHTYSHATICHSGSIVVRKEGREVVANNTFGAVVLIPNQWHEIECLEDGTVFENVMTENSL